MMKTIKKLLPSIAVISIVLIFILTTYKVQRYEAPDFYDRPYQIKKSKMDSLNDSLRNAQQKLDGVKYDYRKYVDDTGELETNTFENLGYAKTGDSHQEKGVEGQMFFVLKSVKLDLQQHVSKSYLQYYTKDGQGYLSRLKITKRKETDTVVHVDQKVDYRYSSKLEGFMIPAKSMMGQFIAQWLGIIYTFFNVLLYLFMVRTFIIFLIKISKNRTFEPQNVARLKTIAVILFVLSLYPLLVNGIAYLLFIGHYGNEGILFTYSFLDRDSYWLMGSMIVYLIYIAFKRGMELQQERDLTI
jgi:hypothetical protein